MLGDNIRKKRKSKKLTISVLAKKIGVSNSYISQLERGLIDPSVSVLRKIAFAMDVPISSLFDEDYEDPLITRLKDRKTIVAENQSYRISWISPNAPKLPLEMIEFRISSNAEITVPENLHNLCLFVTDGCLDIQYEGTASSLYTGDSVFIPRNSAYKIINPGSKEALGLISFSKGSDTL